MCSEDRDEKNDDKKWYFQKIIEALVCIAWRSSDW